MEFHSSGDRYVSDRPLSPLSSHDHHRCIHRRDFRRPQPPPFNFLPPRLYPPFPPPPSSPPLFAPHQPNMFLDQHNTSPRVLSSRNPLPLSEFDNPYPPLRPESWTDPPRVSPYRPTSSYNSDYEFNSARSCFRDFRDEFDNPYTENHGAAKNQTQLLFSDGIDDSVGNYNSCGFNFGDEPIRENMENYESGYGSVFENERFLHDSRNENRSRRLMEMEHVHDSVKTRNREREEREGSFHTPKKKSVLLRIGKPNEVRNGRNHGHNSGSSRSKEKQKDHSMYSNHRVYEGRECSPVDLDVSFKSRAKAIVTDQSSPGKSFTPRNRKARKVAMSNSPPRKLVERCVRLGNSTHVSDCPSTSEKKPPKVETITVSGTLSMSNSLAEISAKETPTDEENIMVSGSVSGMKSLSDSRVVKRSLGETVSDESNKMSGLCESPSNRIRKKKKIASLSSNSSNLKLTKKEIEAVSLNSLTNTPLAPNQTIPNLEENISCVDVKYDDIVSLPSPDVLNVNRLDSSPQAIASDMDNGVNNSGGRSLLLDSMRNTVPRLLDSLGTLETEFDKCTGIPCESVDLSASCFVSVRAEFQNGYTASGIPEGHGVGEEACKDGKDAWLENGFIKESSEGNDAGSNGNASLSGPHENKIYEGCGDLYLAKHDHSDVSSSDIGIKSITVSNIDLMDEGLKHSPLNKTNSLGHTGIEEEYLNVADQGTINKFSSCSNHGSPSSSNIGFTNIQGDRIVSITCHVDDFGNQVWLSEPTMIQENTVVKDCPDGVAPTADNLEVCSGIDNSPNGKRKRSTGGIRSDFSSPRMCETREDTILSYSVKTLPEENDDSSGAGNLRGSTRKESFLEAGILEIWNDVGPDEASPKNIKKIKVSHTDEIIATDSGSALTLEKSLNNFVNEMKLNQVLVTDPLINTQNASFPFHDRLQVLKPFKGDSNITRKRPTSAVPKVFAGPSSLHLNYSKRTTPTNHNAKSRSWHRPGAYNSSVLVSKTFPAPVPAPMISPGKAGKVQGSSYIRKGNSLVRKPGKVSAIPHASRATNLSVYHLNPSSKDDIRKSSESESKLITNGSASWLRTRDGDETKKSSRSESRGGIASSASHLRIGGSATYEGPKTPPLPHINKSLGNPTHHAEDYTYTLLVNSPSDTCSETTSVPMEQISDVDIPNILNVGPKFSESSQFQTGVGLNNDFGSHRVLDEENTGKKITYVKQKSYQLIAATNSDQDVDKTQALSSDSYYKRKNNQLIRASMANHAIPRDVTGNTISSEGEMTPSVAATRSSVKRHFNKVWRLSNTHSSKKYSTSSRQKPHLFPWKRAACWQSSMHNSAYNSTYGSVSLISRKLLLPRNRDTVYTRSRRGFSLRISKLLSVGGRSLKWSKSIEKNSKRANEEATLAVAAAQKKKREQNNARCNVGTKSRNIFFRERVFRIGSTRYKMDPTGRTLQRISDAEPSCSSISKSEKNVKKSYVPRKLIIGNEEYVRIGNGNQLVRDPKKRTRTLASEKVRWSLHTARLRLARKSKYCQFFTRFGKCNKDDGKCPYVHDHSKIAVCTKFLNGSCTTTNCKLTHKVLPERMQDCSYYQHGLCSNNTCPYRHVNVNANASICEGFLKGYCDDGNECRKKHTYVCPKYGATGICPQGSKCKLHHPKKRSTGIEKKSPREKKNVRGRYFGSRTVNTVGSGMYSPEKLHSKNKDDRVYIEGKFTEYISLNISDEEAENAVGPSNEQITTCLPDVKVCELDELIKPISVMYRIPTAEPSPVNDSLGERSASYMSEQSML